MLYTILQRYRFFVDATRDAAQNNKVPQTGAVVTVGRGLHSSTFQLNLSHYYRFYCSTF